MFKQVLLLVFTLAAFTYCNNASDDKKEAATEAKVPETVAPAPAPAAPTSNVPVLPAFNMLDANDQLVDLSKLKGKKVFVNLWATWCPPCRAEMPSIQKLHAKVPADKASFVMISLDNDFGKAKDYVTRGKMKMPLYYPAANLPELFNVQGIPATFIFNEKGELIHRQDGSADYDTKFYEELLSK